MILFGEASLSQVETMKKCLDQFRAVLWSKVSLAKSKIYFFPNTNLHVRNQICSTLAMESTEDMSTYLGIPTIHGRTSKLEYQFVVDRIDAKLVGWKQKMLSIAGRSTLAQTFLCSTPYYAIQTTKLPCSICDRVDQKVRDFGWGDTTEKRGTHLVSWANITKPKDEGGLGLWLMRQVMQRF